MAVAAKWPISEATSRSWGYANPVGTYENAKGPYLRSAIRQLGHAMGLNHPLNMGEPVTDGTFMNQMGDLQVFVSPTGQRFPNNFEFNFSAINLLRIRHHSDLMVRPGGPQSHKALGALPFNTATSCGEAELAALVKEE
jgi:hypothetical protein